MPYGHRRGRVPPAAVGLAGAACGLLGLAVLAASGIPATEAAWRDSVRARGTFSAGTVAPPTGLTCQGSALTGLVSFTWTAPVGGVARTGYSWSMTGVVTRSGTLAAGATSLVQTVPLVTLGTGTVTVRATGPETWTSTSVSRSFLVVTGGIISCS